MVDAGVNGSNGYHGLNGDSNGGLNEGHERLVVASRNALNSCNKATVVLGAQWGDEGKGKLVDLLAAKTKIVCRCQVSAFSLIP